MNNKGISAVVGVILMVAITVAIATTVYVYVSDVAVDHKNTIEINEVLTNISIEYKYTDYKRLEYCHLTFGNDTYRLQNNDFKWIVGNTYNIKLDYNDYYDYYTLKSYQVVVNETR